MTDQYQAANDEELNDVTDSNFHQISNVSEMESAGALFDEAGATHTSPQGVLKATASLDDGLVSVEGMQLPRAIAEQMGLIRRTAPNDINYQVEVENQTETAHESTDDVLADLPMLDEAQTSLLDQAMAFDGGSVDKAISDVLAYGDISDNTLSDLVRASGADADAVNSTIEAVSTNLDSQVEALSGVTGASDLLRLASESQPKLVKASIMSAVNGDVSSALDLAKSTYQNLDQTSYADNLEVTLNEAGYKTIWSNGRLAVSGNELADPTAWSTASSLFTINFTD